MWRFFERCMCVYTARSVCTVYVQTRNTKTTRKFKKQRIFRAFIHKPDTCIQTVPFSRNKWFQTLVSKFRTVLGLHCFNSIIFWCLFLFFVFFYNFLMIYWFKPVVLWLKQKVHLCWNTCFSTASDLTHFHFLSGKTSTSNTHVHNITGLLIQKTKSPLCWAGLDHTLKVSSS